MKKNERIIKTLHGPKYHTALMDDGVWMLETYSTEIDLVRALSEVGFKMSDGDCIKTDKFNGLLRHTWVFPY